MIYQKKSAVLLLLKKKHTNIQAKQFVFFFQGGRLIFSCDVPLCTNKKVGDLIRFEIYIGEYLSVTQISDSRNLSFNVYGNIT